MAGGISEDSALAFDAETKRYGDTSHSCGIIIVWVRDEVPFGQGHRDIAEVHEQSDQGIDPNRDVHHATHGGQGNDDRSAAEDRIVGTLSHHHEEDAGIPCTSGAKSAGREEHRILHAAGVD